MGDLDRLLVVQDHDTRLDQLRHRRRTLPERAEVASEQAAVDELQAAIAAADERRGVLIRSQRHIEDEIAGLELKIAQTDRTLYGGTVSNRRELEALQAELGALRRRQRKLEDQDLDVMEQLEPVDAQLEKLHRQHQERSEVLERCQQRLSVAEVELDVAISSQDEERSAAAAGLPGELMAEYESLRRAPGGIGVARLDGAMCTGCNLTLSSVEVNRIRKHQGDDVPHCEECGRLLVVA